MYLKPGLPSSPVYAKQAKMMHALAEFFGSYNYSVDSVDAGRVYFDKNAMREVVEYINSDAEFAAVKASPAVIKRGKIVDKHTDHKDRSEVKSYTFAAPVILNGKRGNEGVVVQLTNRSKPHCVRIIMPDGSGFDFTPMEKAVHTSSAAASDDSRQQRNASAFNNKITPTGDSVNTSIRELVKIDATKTANYTDERITSLMNRYLL